MFNLYWLWHLGRELEKILGWWRWLAFFVSAAFVSSGLELIASDETGIGASGVGYAMFGFLWRVRDRFPKAKAVVTDRIVFLFLAWAFLCLWLTEANVLQVGNAAHFGGLVFGGLTASAFCPRRLVLVPSVGLAAMLLTIVALLNWCPWSQAKLWPQISRHWEEAYSASISGDVDEALTLYTEILRLKPDDADALFNRSIANQELGHDEAAMRDYHKAIRLNPDLADRTGRDAVVDWLFQEE